MLRGGFRAFPAVFAYSLAAFFSTVIEMPLAVYYFRTHDRSISARWVSWYWRDEIGLQLLVFIVVMSLIWQATSEARARRPMRAAMILGSLLVAGISFLVEFNPKIAEGLWLTPWARDLNFASALLDMLLWALLLAKRQKDSRVLMLSGGLGIMFTGEAIGEAIRQESIRSLSQSVALAGGILMVITNLVFLYVWWQTFRPLQVTRTTP